MGFREAISLEAAASEAGTEFANVYELARCGTVPWARTLFT